MTMVGCPSLYTHKLKLLLAAFLLGLLWDYEIGGGVETRPAGVVRPVIDCEAVVITQFAGL